MWIHIRIGLRELGAAAGGRNVRSAYSGRSARFTNAEEHDEDLSEQAIRERYCRYSKGVQSALSALDHEAVNYELGAQLVRYFLQQPAPEGPSGKPQSAILLFLSGAKEIDTMHSAVLAINPELSKEPACSWIFTLHSSRPAEEQRAVFERPPAGVRKLIFATNIAETSITIDDVGVVIDTGRVKELRYDSTRRISSLEDVFVSRASARQRRGRAGRVGPGTCVHLMTRYRHDQLLSDYPEAEVRRVPLEQLVLRIHASSLVHLSGGSTEAACALLVEPPDPSAVRQSLSDLVSLGALELVGGAERTECLTMLGRRLAELPVDARVGKLALVGAAFGCFAFDASVTVAASLAVHGSPFTAPRERRHAAQRAHRAFAEKMTVGDLICSDTLATLQAFDEWDMARQRGWRGSKRGSHESPLDDEAAEVQRLCRDGFLRTSVLHEIAKTRSELLEIFADAEVVPRAWCQRRPAWRCPHGLVDHLRLQNLAPLVTGLLCASFFPQLAVVVPRETLASRLEMDTRCAPIDLFVCTPAADSSGSSSSVLVPAAIHPSSVSAREKIFGTPYIIYRELLHTSRLFVRDVTPVPPLALALFAGALAKNCVRPQAQPAKSSKWTVLEVGGVVRLAMTGSVCGRLLEIRKRLDGIWMSTLVARGSATLAAGRSTQARQEALAEAIAALIREPVA